uniref:Uncharacterized protein n=1 Tax=Anguilla anguilla TaxID=7936 RepID=A0A0E9UWC9_ANGAN
MPLWERFYYKSTTDKNI